MKTQNLLSGLSPPSVLDGGDNDTSAQVCNLAPTAKYLRHPLFINPVVVLTWLAVRSTSLLLRLSQSKLQSNY